MAEARSAWEGRVRPPRCPGSQLQPPAVPTHPGHALLHSHQRCYAELGIRSCPGRELLEGKAEMVREEKLVTGTATLLNNQGEERAGTSQEDLWFSSKL